MKSIADNIKAIRKTVLISCKKANRDPSEVRIIAISKGFGADAIAAALETGLTDIGENYLNESLPKQEALKHLPIRWHFSGHIQRNKADLIAEHFQFIQGVDSWRLAETLNNLFKKTQKRIPILLQLKTSPQAAHGFEPEDLIKNQEKLLQLDQLDIRGIMTMGYPVENSEDARPFFTLARETFLELKKNLPENFKELSMGMSGDFR